jgi:hypothetical protein
LNSPLLAANAVQQIRSRRVNWLNTPLLAAEIVNSRICFIDGESLRKICDDARLDDPVGAEFILPATQRTL